VNAMTCRQNWKVEAVRDGRLAALESESLANHVKFCFACAAEVERLEQIAEAVRTIPVREPSPLVVRIERRRLLEEAAQKAAPSSRFQGALRLRAQPLRVFLDAAAVFLLVWVGLRHVGWKSTESVALAPSSSQATSETTMVSSEIEVRATPESRWSQRSEPTVQLIALEQGALWTKISHNRPHPPVVFRVPDGQIEDVGTTFTVSVQAGRTRHVAVEEGAVVVRLRGEREVRLTAGQVWNREEGVGTAADNRPSEPANTGSSAAVAAGPTDPPASGEVADDPGPAPAELEALQNAQRAPRAASSNEGAASKDRGRASKAARRAVARENKLKLAATSAFRAGRYDEAARLYERYAATHPSDEDAAYLRALALNRAGRTEEAHRAAQVYLSRFPSGFRRTEMEETFAPGSKR
jgi:hypothetical protein